MSKKNKNKAKDKKPPEKKGEPVNLTNGMIDGFQRNPAIGKLRRASGIRAELKFKLFKLIKTITDSPEAKALRETIDEMVQKHETGWDKLKKELKSLKERMDSDDFKIELEQKTVKRISELEKRLQPLQITEPEIQELFEVESGLSIEKLIIPIEQLPSDFTADDMFATDWIIEYEE